MNVLGQPCTKQYFEEQSKVSEVREAGKLNICSQPDPLSKGGHNLYCIIGNCIISNIGATVTVIVARLDTGLDTVSVQ